MLCLNAGLLTKCESLRSNKHVERFSFLISHLQIYLFRHLLGSRKEVVNPTIVVYLHVTN